MNSETYESINAPADKGQFYLYTLKTRRGKTLATGHLAAIRDLMKQVDPKCKLGHYIQVPV